nr:ExeM/NucH family extracellular endonuclease [Anaerolineae bacterium]
LVIALDGLDADVIGLMEIENDGGANQALESLVVALNNYDNANNNNNDWAFIDADVIGTDEIKVAYLYDASRVAPEGDFAILDNVAPFNVNTRPPLAQTFRELDTDQTFTVVVNHFKSKGSCPSSGPDTDQGDGQSCWNATRVTAAQVMLDWFSDSLGSNPFDVADTENIIVIGDLNSYALEDPIDVLKAAGYSDLLREFGGSSAYGYVFDAVAGYLDYALVNANLRPYVTGAADWHINADEPLGRDYDQDFSRQPEFYQLNEFRTSDHDPVLLGFTTPGTLGVLNVPTPISVGAPLVVTVTDPDWTRTSITATVTTANGDSETLILAVTGTPGVFSGSINTASGTANVGNSTLEVTTPETVTVTYNDPLNAAGVAQVVTANATVEGPGVTGSINAPATAVPGDDAITVTVTDTDLTTSATVTATTTGGDSETLTLNGSGGTFSITLNTGVGPATASNGTLETVDGDVITFTYTDTQDASGSTTNVTAVTSVAYTSTPSSFTLTAPAEGATLLSSDAAATFTWTQAANSKAYTLYVFKLSDNVRVGVVLQAGIDASDACTGSSCTYTADPSDFDSGKYAWTVIADGVGSADVEASNGGLVFSVNTDEIELVENGGFELARANNPKRPVAWSVANLSLDRRQCNSRGNGSDCALSFRGNPGELSTFSQTLDFSSYAMTGGESISLSADIYTDRANPGRMVILTITYVDPTAGANNNGIDTLIIKPTGAPINTYITYAVDGVLDGEVASASVRVQYRKFAGTVRVDNVSVILSGDTAPRSTVLPMPEAPGN